MRFKLKSKMGVKHQKTEGQRKISKETK